MPSVMQWHYYACGAYYHEWCSAKEKSELKKVKAQPLKWNAYYSLCGHNQTPFIFQIPKYIML